MWHPPAPQKTYRHGVENFISRSPQEPPPEETDYCPSPVYEFHQSLPEAFQSQLQSQPGSPRAPSPMLDYGNLEPARSVVRSIPDLPPSQFLIQTSAPGASMELLSPSPPTSTISLSLPHLQSTILDPVTHTIVLVSSICTTLSAQLDLSHQSLLKPVFQAFADRVLKTKPVIVADEIQALLKQYATGFNYDGIRRAREEAIRAFTRNWSQMGLDCAASAKDILSKDICKSTTKQLRDRRVTSTLCESLLETVRLALNKCLTRANERIKELAQDHMIIIGTHDHQALAIKANALHEQVVRGAKVPDNVRTVASEVHAYFSVSSGEFIDSCIRIILRQLMHQLSLQLSSELLGALKLSEADLSERSRTWVE